MEKLAFRQVRCADFGWQTVILDERDYDLLVAPFVVQSGIRLKWVVDDLANPGKRIGLARAVATRHVKRPSAAADCIGFRNGSAADCRASNLYWATRRQLLGAGNHTFRQDMMRQPAVRVARAKELA